ncbi:unnamed protein product [Aphanomyces euteiches]
MSTQSWQHPQTNSQHDQGTNGNLSSSTQSPYRGLINQGATGYLNAPLQTLFMTPEFRRRLYQVDTDNDEQNVAFQVQKLFAQLQLKKDQQAVETKGLTTSFGWSVADLFVQHDVQEFYRVLFEALKKSLQGTHDANLISDLFEGQLKEYIQCATCGDERSRLENFIDLGLSLRPDRWTSLVSSVEEAIKLFTKPEIFSGDNQLICTKCGEKRDAIKGLKFHQLPYLLSLQLNRFEIDFTTFTTVKLGQEVKFPKYLNMNAFVHGSQSSMDDEIDSWHSNYDVSSVVNVSGPHVYELYSVTVHSGSAMGGQYYVYIKSFEDGQWYKFNDSDVTSIKEADVRAMWGQKLQSASPSSTCAYMLMYGLVDPKRNEATISDAEVPAFLKDGIAAHDAKTQRQLEEKASFIDLKIICPPSLKTLSISKLTPLSKVTMEAAKSFGIESDPRLFRLRSYDELMNLPQETYTGKEHFSLAQLKLDTHSSLYLEVRSSTADEWEDYDLSALQLLVRKYEPLPKPHFTEPLFVLQIATDATVEDLVEKLRVKYGLDRGKCRVLHMASMEHMDPQTDILNPTEQDVHMKVRLFRDFRLLPGSHIYVEECPTLDAWSGAKDLFEQQANSITIQVKCSDKSILAHRKDPAVDSNDGATWRFVVDRRQPIQILKDHLVKFLNLSPDAFKLCRGSSTAPVDLKSLEMSFKAASLIHNSVLHVVPGRALNAGEFHIQIDWYQPKPQPSEPSVILHGGLQRDEFSWLATFIVSGDVMVDRLRTAIAQQFATKGIEAPYLRLRDYSNGRLMRILVDGVKLNEVPQLTLYENHQFVVEILSAPENVPTDHVLFNASVFDRVNLKFGPRHEVFIDLRISRHHWIDILADSVHMASGVPIASMVIAKPPQRQDVNVLDVDKFTWINRDQCRMDPNPQSLGDCGDQLVVSDGSIALKKLRPDEQAELVALVNKLNSSLD